MTRDRDKNRTKRQAMPDARRTNGFAVNPETLLVIGADTSHRSRVEHPLYDERVHLPLDEAMIANILQYGQIKNVNVRKRPDGQFEVVAGRRFTLHAREVRRRQKEAKISPLFKVECTVRKYDDATASGVMLSENEIRLADDPIVRAGKIADHVALIVAGGKSKAEAVAEAAIAAGCTGQTVRNRLAVHRSTDKVKAAVREGAVSETAAGKIGGLPEPEQERALAEMTVGDAPASTVKDAERAARNARKPNGEEPEFEAPPRSVLKRLALDPKKADDEKIGKALAGLDPVGRAAIRFMLGMGGARGVPGLSAACRAVGFIPGEDAK